MYRTGRTLFPNAAEVTAWNSYFSYKTILSIPLLMAKLAALEKGRLFCSHQMDHLLAVARIAYIRNLERNLGLKKESIYAAALLHDIGKYAQYEEGIPHEIKSAEIAGIIPFRHAGKDPIHSCRTAGNSYCNPRAQKTQGKRYPAGKSAI